MRGHGAVWICGGTVGRMIPSRRVLCALAASVLCSCTVVAQPASDAMAYVDRVFREITRLRLTGKAARSAVDSCIRTMSAWRATLGDSARSAQRMKFPLKGRGCASVPSHGKGFVGASVYSFFDGNSHRGHPALDLFILDRNMDSKDDRTGQSVDVVSITDGLVVSVTVGWTPDSTDAAGYVLRGGICAWIYDPVAHALWYYAHLGRLRIKAGHIVRAGQTIGQLGRTGKNAAARRSSTHLHLMFLSLGTPTLTPRNPYRTLCGSGSD